MQSWTCYFSNAILSSRCGCKNAAKNCVAEKEFAACFDENSSKKCEKLYQFLYENSGFAVGGLGQNSLTVSQLNKIRIGGLKGLNELMFNTDSVKNIDNLVQELEQKYQTFENIPLETIIPKIAHFKMRG